MKKKSDIAILIEIETFNERNGKMELKEAYEVMQAAWIDLYDVKVGDTVKVLREMQRNELGCRGGLSGKINENCQYKIMQIDPNSIGIRSGDWPFFCLEKVESAPHTIAFDGQEPIEISDKSYESLKKALK